MRTWQFGDRTLHKVNRTVLSQSYKHYHVYIERQKEAVNAIHKRGKQMEEQTHVGTRTDRDIDRERV